MNDTYGHLVGDRVLAHVASLVRGTVRDVDSVARYGGEEFVVVLSEATAEGALDSADRIRALVETSPIELAEKPIPVTISVGVSPSREGDVRPEEALARADAALYEAKRAGRNRVVVAP